MTFPEGRLPIELLLACGLRILVAAACGFAVGFERRARFKEAGIRTHLIVALGAALITIVSKYGFLDAALYAPSVKVDPTRVASQIVSGVGFLGAGMIFTRHKTVTGLTTAAGIWTTAGIGMAAGCGLYGVALFATVLIVLVQLVLHMDRRSKRAAGQMFFRLRTKAGPRPLEQLFGVLEEMGVQVLNLEMRCKSNTVQYELFMRLPTGLTRQQVCGRLGELEGISYVYT